MDRRAADLVGNWLAIVWFATLLLYFSVPAATAAPPQFAPVLPDTPLLFPQDFGAHPAFRTEWWYVTGWLETPDKKPLGFQITFFRSATMHDPADPSRFAPKQLIIAHAALSDPAFGKLQHGQKSAREGFGLAYAKLGNTDVKLDDWYLTRDINGNYQAEVTTRDFSLHVALSPSQAPLPEGEQGFSRKGPQQEQASYYYSEPQLRVSGTLIRHGKPQAVNGRAWLDHEWSSNVLGKEASGWNWIGANLDDGSAFMAFQIRNARGDKLWAHATLREKSGQITQFAAEQVVFEPVRLWRSPRTNVTYPVATRIHVGSTLWELAPLQDDQELDARISTGAIYWEGAVKLTRDGRDAGHGYLELTGYGRPLKL
jgi:predicted secreted hydrolase